MDWENKEDFDICWAKKKRQQGGIFHPFIHTPTVSRICFLKLYKNNYFRKCFHGLSHPLQNYLCMKGDTTVSASHHSEVQSWISQVVTRLIKFYQNHASWYSSLQKVFCKVTCLLLYEHTFSRCGVPSEFQENTAKTRSVQKPALSDPETKLAGKLIDGETCKIPRFHDWTPKYQQEQGTYHKCLNIKTKAF